MNSRESVFKEFCGASLWPGVGSSLTEELLTAGMCAPDHVSEKALAELPSVTDKRARRLYSAWLAAAPAYDLVTLLVPHDLPARWARRLDGMLGGDAAAALAADPWQLLQIREATVAQADRLARGIDAAVSPHDPRRTRALVDWVLARDARQGHTICPAVVVADALQPYGIRDDDQFYAAVAAGVSAGIVAVVAGPAGGDERWLSRAPLAAAEESVARHLHRLEAGAKKLASAKKARAAAKGLDKVQAAAVVAAAGHGVTLLTGGPGTGKSRTITAVVDLCRSAGLDIALAAPTGRAAKRLTELLLDAASGAENTTREGTTGEGINGEAMTIHRLLGARKVADGHGSTFEHDESNPIDADIVVIDEASMLDVELAAALLAAIPDGAHLLIVGDPAQLPSIGPGRVLGDILASEQFPLTELSTLYRQTAGGAIARLATAVRGGDLVAPDTADHEVVLVRTRGSAPVAERVVQLVTDSIPRVFHLAGEQIQVVTPVHGGPAGTQALNRALKKELNPAPARGRRSVRGFDAGDRVVATANHLDAKPVGYANGEVGTVIDTSGKALLVAFPSGESEISGKALGDLLHGWAITVHRAQGSEWDAVIVVLPPEAGRMLSRPLIYTALTRARRHLSIVHAAGPAVAHAVRHVGSKPRHTRIEGLIRAQRSRNTDTGAISKSKSVAGSGVSAGAQKPV